ncbi:outer membrane lipoprotein-sorting protein [Spirochaetota bacterium]
MKKHITIIILCMVVGEAYSASLPSVKSIMKQIDLRQKQTSDITVKVNIVQNKVNQGIKNFEFIYFRRDKRDKFLIIAIAPKSEKGNGYLRVGENFWMYRQNTRTFQHISRDESIMGTDARGGDFERRKLSQLYKPYKGPNGKTDIIETKLGKKRVYKFTLVARVRDVTYPKQVYWIEKRNYLPLKVQSYSLAGTLMQTAYYPKWTKVHGRYIPLQHIYVDEFEKGNKSIVQLSGISLKKLNPRIFTKAYLENLSK